MSLDLTPPVCETCLVSSPSAYADRHRVGTTKMGFSSLFHRVTSLWPSLLHAGGHWGHRILSVRQTPLPGGACFVKTCVPEQRPPLVYVKAGLQSLWDEVRLAVSMITFLSNLSYWGSFEKLLSRRLGSICLKGHFFFLTSKSICLLQDVTLQQECLWQVGALASA